MLDLTRQEAAAKAKLAPRALWWFRWGAMATFLTGLVLLGMMSHGPNLLNDYMAAVQQPARKAAE